MLSRVKLARQDRQVSELPVQVEHPTAQSTHTVRYKKAAGRQPHPPSLKTKGDAQVRQFEGLFVQVAQLLSQVTQTLPATSSPAGHSQYPFVPRAKIYSQPVQTLADVQVEQPIEQDRQDRLLR